MLLAAIDRVNLDQFLHILSAVDQEEHNMAIKALDGDSPKLYWIFKNMDYSLWISAETGVLWISGPPKCCIRQASSHIVDIIKNKASETQHSVLYFFCSPTTPEKSIAAMFVRALLLQIIRYSPPHKQMTGIKVFLRTLLDAFLGRQSVSNLKLSSPFKDQTSLDKMIRNLLDASGSEHWDALKAVLNTEHNQKLSLIIDGLNKIDHIQAEFIIDVCAFIKQLQESSFIVKALLTSQPNSEIKGPLHELQCIEYDKERNGPIALFL